MTSTNSSTVLLVMDIQERAMSIASDGHQLTANLQTAIAAARAKGIPVVYAVLGFREGYPEVHPENKMFQQLFRSGGWFVLEKDEGAAIPAAVAPLPGEIVVNKKRVSAFAGCDLELVLRRYRAEQLVLTGLSTSGVVLSTLREAADKDYEITVLSDCCADRDPETHDFLMKKIFPRQATVKTAGEWAAGL